MGGGRAGGHREESKEEKPVRITEAGRVGRRESDGSYNFSPSLSCSIQC